jgi:DNA replication protein DnaC
MTKLKNEIARIEGEFTIASQIAFPASSEGYYTTGNLGAKLLNALERIETKRCAECGATFEAVGFQGYCIPCGILIDEKSSRPPLRKLDSSWPKLHADKLDSLTGPSADMAQRLAPRLFGNRLLVLAGDRGRGKTQIATYLAYHRMTKGHDSGIYQRAFDACRMCDGYDIEARRALIAFQKVPFLCLDECHRIEARRIGVLESILDARYANKRPTVIIGNWMTAQGIEHGEEVSGQKHNGLGPTIMDRINEHTKNRTGGVVWCKWASYRKGDGKGGIEKNPML